MMKRFINTYDGPGGTECGYWEDEDTIYPLLREFFFFMDATEESESGTSFKPNRISSTRIADAHRIEQLLSEIKARMVRHEDEFKDEYATEELK